MYVCMFVSLYDGVIAVSSAAFFFTKIPNKGRNKYRKEKYCCGMGDCRQVTVNVYITVKLTSHFLITILSITTYRSNVLSSLCLPCTGR